MFMSLIFLGVVVVCFVFLCLFVSLTPFILLISLLFYLLCYVFIITITIKSLIIMASYITFITL